MFAAKRFVVVWANVLACVSGIFGTPLVDVSHGLPGITLNLFGAPAQLVQVGQSSRQY